LWFFQYKFVTPPRRCKKGRKEENPEYGYDFLSLTINLSNLYFKEKSRKQTK